MENSSARAVLSSGDWLSIMTKLQLLRITLVSSVERIYSIFCVIQLWTPPHLSAVRKMSWMNCAED